MSRGSVITTVVFDIGGVLIDWNPRHLYRRLLGEPAMEEFLANVCTLEWHRAHDAGTPMATTAAQLVERFPAHEALIDAWNARWNEMFGGPIEGSVTLLEELVAKGYPVHGLTNWPAEKFDDALAMFPFLDHLQPVVVSGREGITKPDPRLFEILIERTGLSPATTLYIDDAPANTATASLLGFGVHTFSTPRSLADELRRAELL